MTETERYEAAWQARRRRFWLYYGMLSVLLGVLLVSALLGFDSVLLACACITGMLYATYWLYQFRCPRCGAIFFSRWADGFFALFRDPLRCEQCGLSVNEMPAGSPNTGTQAG